MKIIERFIQSKTTNADDCEDGIFANDQYVAVVDGATSQSPRVWHGKKSGKIATELILARLPTMEPDLDAAQCMRVLSREIATWYAHEDIYEYMRRSSLERCSAAIAVYSRSKNQLWFVADCQAIIDGEYYSNDMPINTLTSNARTLFIELGLCEGKTIQDFQEHDRGREFIFPLLVRQRLLQNIESDSEFAYAVLDGFFKDVNAIKVVDVPRDAKEIIIASDGYPELRPTLAGSEQALKEVLAEDPLLFRRHKSTKGLQRGNLSYDDRAYIRFVL